MFESESSFLIDGKNYYESELPDLTGGRVTSIQFADNMIKIASAPKLFAR